MPFTTHRHKKSPNPPTGFKSESQRLKLQELVAQGKMTEQEYSIWEQATPKNQALPAKLNKPKKVKSTKRVT